MFRTDTNGQGSADESSSLGAGLLLSTSISSSSSDATSLPDKYGRLWRRGITVGILITVKKTSNDPGEGSLPSPTASSEGSLPSPTASSPLLNHDTEPNSCRQETLDTNNPVHETGFLNLVSRTCNSFRKSFGDQETSATICDRVPSSRVNQHAIDIREEERNEEQQLRNRIGQIVKKRDLDLLKSLGGVEKVASVFGSHLEGGINSTQDPQIWDTDKPIQAEGFFYFLLKAGNNYTIFLLLVSAGLSFSTEIVREGPKYGWHDGAVILVAVSMLVAFPSVTNFRRAKKLEKKLWKEKNKLEVKVVRNGESQLITISNLLPGDIIVLKKGDRVPADGLVVSGDGLVLDGVLNSKIDLDQNPFICSGSKVKEGQGNMIVTSVGANTTLGKLLSLVIRDPNKKALLQAQIEKPNAYIENLSLFVSMLIALVALIRLLSGKHVEDDNELPELKGNVSVKMLLKTIEGILLKPRGKISILASALSVVVIAIQHGMPFVITVSLSCWNDKVEKTGAKPQNLSACATMSIVTVMCIDATGGLVCKDSEVNRFWIGEKDLKNDMDSEINPAVVKALERSIGASLLVPATSASPANDSLISWVQSRWGMNVEVLDQNLRIHGYRKLSSNSYCCGFLMTHGGDEEKIMHMHWSGAASMILDMCSHYYDSNGRSHAIKDVKSRFELVIQDMEGNGLRPFAFACGKTETQEIKEDGLHLLALAGLKYPILEETKLLVEAFREAGVRIILVSEDELSVVRAMGWELGTRPKSNAHALEGEQIRYPNVTGRKEIVERVTLLGSCLAEDKLLLVQSLQQNGRIVAFFGGSSTSDTAALKEADVGIVDVEWSTEMARENSDIVIWSKGSLSTILKYGRCSYHNIQMFSQLQLTVCISGLLITFISAMSLAGSPITTVKLIWVNWITCFLGGVMMVMELQAPKLITSPPAEKSNSVLNKVIWNDIVIQVLCQASVLLVFQFKGQVILGMNKDILKAMIFNSFTLSQIFNLFYAMNLLKKEVLLSVLRNIWFVLGLVSVIVMHVLVGKYLDNLFGSVRLNWIEWIECLLLAALPCGIHVVVKFILRSNIYLSLYSYGLQIVLLL